MNLREHFPEGYFRASWIIAAAIAGVCLALALITYDTIASLKRENIGRVILYIWVLGPPLFFWHDWNRFYSCDTIPCREWREHAHDLGRNLWVAFTLLLAFLFGFNPPGSG